MSDRTDPDAGDEVHGRLGEGERIVPLVEGGYCDLAGAEYWRKKRDTVAVPFVTPPEWMVGDYLYRTRGGLFVHRARVIRDDGEIIQELWSSVGDSDALRWLVEADQFDNLPDDLKRSVRGRMAMKGGGSAGPRAEDRPGPGDRAAGLPAPEAEAPASDERPAAVEAEPVTVIRPPGKESTIDGVSVGKLTPAQFAILKALAEAPGRLSFKKLAAASHQDHPDSILKYLIDKGVGWERVIERMGTGKGYRLIGRVSLGG